MGESTMKRTVDLRLIDFEFTAHALFLGVSRHLGMVAPVFLALSVLTIKWLFLWFLYGQRIFLRA